MLKKKHSLVFGKFAKHKVHYKSMTGHTTITSQLDNFYVQTQQTKKTHENKGKYL